MPVASLEYAAGGGPGACAPRARRPRGGQSGQRRPPEKGAAANVSVRHKNGCAARIAIVVTLSQNGYGAPQCREWCASSSPKTAPFLTLLLLLFWARRPWRGPGGCSRAPAPLPQRCGGGGEARAGGAHVDPHCAGVLPAARVGSRGAGGVSGFLSSQHRPRGCRRRGSAWVRIPRPKPSFLGGRRILNKFSNPDNVFFRVFKKLPSRQLQGHRRRRRVRMHAAPPPWKIRQPVPLQARLPLARLSLCSGFPSPAVCGPHSAGDGPAAHGRGLALRINWAEKGARPPEKRAISI